MNAAYYLKAISFFKNNGRVQNKINHHVYVLSIKVGCYFTNQRLIYTLLIHLYTCLFKAQVDARIPI